MPGAEFRYVASESSKGSITASYLDDQLSDPSEVDYYRDTGFTHDNSDRYWVRGKADYNFGNNWQTRFDLDIVSDQDYLREFNTGTTGFESTQERYLEAFGRNFQNDTSTLRQNTAKILRSWSGMSLEGNLVAVDDISTLSDGTNTPLMQLPEIDFNGTMPTGFADVNLDWDTNYVYYWREDGIGGNRFDIFPSLSSPIPMGPYLESRAELGVRDTLYFVSEFGDTTWDNDTTQNRIYPEFNAEVATTWERDFFAQSESTTTIRHQIRPYTRYTYIPDVNQDDLPYFDGVDLIGEQNRITYGFDNFFNRVGDGLDGSDSLSDYATLQIEQSYDFRNSSSDEPFSDIYLRLRWLPFSRGTLDYKTFYDVYGSGFASHAFEGTVYNSRGDFFGLEYSYQDVGDIDQINAYLGATIFDRWVIGGGVQQSISLDETIQANGSITYNALCWSVKFETRYIPEETSFLLVFNLANIGIPLGITY
jgi:LPS-assembly protein